jgi:hypothetical protein
MDNNDFLCYRLLFLWAVYLPHPPSPSFKGEGAALLIKAKHCIIHIIILFFIQHVSTHPAIQQTLQILNSCLKFPL